MQKIWLDTDIGSDIDDALALAFLLARPDCQLVGISTVTERDNERAKLASALCQIAGKNIPIFPGATDGLLIPTRQTEVHQRGALENWPHDEKFPSIPAALALREAILKNPGEISLLTIGPLTNIALAFALDPILPSLLKEIVLMCGAFNSRGWVDGCEWNALLDPHATAMVYNAKIARHASLGLDVTTKVSMNRPQFERACQGSKLLECALDMAHHWFKRSSWVIFHDPLAAASLFEPEICHWTRGTVEIETASAKLGGFTHWKRENDGAHQVAETVDAARFFEIYFGAFQKDV